MKEATKIILSEILPVIPNIIPESFADDIKKETAHLGNIIIYRTGTKTINGKRKRMVRGLCTSCHNESEFQYTPIHYGCSRVFTSTDTYGFYASDVDRRIIKSFENFQCPKCGARTIARCINSFNEVCECGNTNVVTVHNVVGNLCVLSWLLRKLTDKNGNIHFLSVKQDGIIIINGEAIRLSGGQNYYYSFSEYPNWKKSNAERFISIDNDLIFNCTKETIERTTAANCALDVFVKQKSNVYIMAYLEAWCKYPQIENLVRQGFSRLLNSMLNNCCEHYGNYIEKITVNVKKLKEQLELQHAKPCKMLGIEKAYLDICRGLDLKEFYCFRYGLSKKLLFTREQIKMLKELGLENFKEWIEKPKYGYVFRIIHLLNYMKKQKEFADQNGRHDIIKLNFLRDYYEALINAYGEIPNSMLFPKDLIKAHNEAIKLVKEKVDPIVDKKIKERLKELDTYIFYDKENKLFIRPCATHEELIKEGKILDHCVARYATRHAEKETTIFFIRHIEEPDEPFYTLEYKNGIIIQDHGYDNAEQTSEIFAFERKWLKFINEQETRNAKEHSKQFAANAGA